MVIEAAVLLAISRALIVALPFQRYRTLLEKPTAGNCRSRHIDFDQVSDICDCIEIAGNNVPWTANCFPQALTGRWMLKRRHIPSKLFLGVERDNVVKLGAHAWLQVDDFIVTGWEEKEKYTVVAQFN